MIDVFVHKIPNHLQTIERQDKCVMKENFDSCTQVMGESTFISFWKSTQIRRNSWFMILIFIADDSLKRIKGGIKKIKVKVGVTVKVR